MTMTASISTPTYLTIGHVAKDIVPKGHTLGGTVAYSGMTAHALGMRVGMITSTSPDLDLQSIASIDILNLPAETPTCFENIYKPEGRIQVIRSIALDLGPEAVPPAWMHADIVHFGPIANEIEPDLPYQFSSSIVAMTPQGWLRRWDEEGAVRLEHWSLLKDILPAADIVVVSIEDLQGDLHAADEMAALCRVLAVTRGPLGARVYWNGAVKDIAAPEVEEAEPTGAGDIFAAAFFIRWAQVKDAWRAARFANIIAANSVTRSGLSSTPLPSEIKAAYTEEL